MSYVFFREVLKQLGRKLDYMAIVNYAGNAFCKDSGDMIEAANPMNISSGHGRTKSQKTLLSILESPDVKIGKPVIPGKKE